MTFKDNNGRWESVWMFKWHTMFIASDIALAFKSWDGIMYGMMNVCES